MTKLQPYLTFNGNCREAMNFYKEALGGELALQTVEGSPVEDQVPAEIKHQILHSSLTTDGLVILASDMAQDALVQGNTTTLSLHFDSEETLTSTFGKLSNGAEVTTPLRMEFWGGMYGALTDQYGFHWIFNYEKQPSQAQS